MLGTDTLRDIFSYLDAASLISCTLVCKHWNLSSSHDSLWKNVCLEDDAWSHVLRFAPQEINWKLFYTKFIRPRKIESPEETFYAGNFLQGDFTFETWLNVKRGGTTILDLSSAHIVGSIFRVSVGSATTPSPTNTIPVISSGSVISAKKSLPLRRWAHLAVVYEEKNNAATIFINGELGGTFEFFFSGQSTSGTKVQIKFDGYLHRMILQRYAKTQKEIQQEMFAPSLSSKQLLFSHSFVNTKPIKKYRPTKLPYFDGIEFFIRTVDDFPASVFQSDFTIEAWVYPERGGVTIMDKCTLEGNADDTPLRIHLGVAGRSDDMRISAWNLHQNLMDPQRTLQKNKWTHIAFAYSAKNENLEFYQNGELTKHKRFKLGGVNNTPLVIGADWLGRFFQGYIAEFRIWSCQRNKMDLMDNFDQPLPAEELRNPHLIAYWKLDHIQGTTFVDSSPNKYHATYAGVLEFKELNAPVPWNKN